jgi:hypothetical protein
MRYLIESGPPLTEFAVWMLGEQKFAQNGMVEFTCREWRNNDSKGKSTCTIPVHVTGFSNARGIHLCDITGSAPGSRIVEIQYSTHNRQGVLITRAGTFIERLIGQLQETPLVSLGVGRLPECAYRLAPGIIALPHVLVRGEYLMFADATRWDSVAPPPKTLAFPIPKLHMAAYGAPNGVSPADVPKYFLPKARHFTGEAQKVEHWVIGD